MNGKQAKRLRRELAAAVLVDFGGDAEPGAELVERVGIPKLAREYRRQMAREERRLARTQGS